MDNTSNTYLASALEFCKKFVEARIKEKPKVNLEKEAADLKKMKQTGDILSIKNTIKKIKEHGKTNKKPPRSRR